MQGVELLLHRGEILVGREVGKVVAAPPFDQRGDGLHHVREALGAGFEVRADSVLYQHSQVLWRKGRGQLQQLVLLVPAQQRAVVVNRCERGGEENSSLASRERLAE